MSYYRRPRADDNPDDIIALDNLVAMVPVEVDEWHPASELPKPEDFKPTRQILTVDTDGRLDLASERRWKITSQLDIEKHKVAIKFWRKISIPK